ncbi:MAG: glycine--tRNA ligase subunit beta [bacterium]
MRNDFVLEIGSEEIPAAFLPEALLNAARSAEELFNANRISYESLVVKGTPRRLVLYVSGLADRQEMRVQEITGPPRSVALNSEGKPTKALEKFCARYQCDAAGVAWVRTEKGEYASVRVTEGGRKTVEILESILTSWVLSIPFPKSMRWGDQDLRFVRPVRWLMALYGEDVVPIQIGDVRSSKRTLGHRFLSERKGIEVRTPGEHEGRLLEQKVILDPQERRGIILSKARSLAAEVSGRLIEDEALLQQLVYLTEYPVPIRGGFEPGFLALPEPVLIATLRDHQKYLAVRDVGTDRLLPHFIAVANTESEDMRLIRKGNERVLRARLEDAKFFFDEDLKTRLEDHLEPLKHVIYHKKLGTSYEKVVRIRTLADFLCRQLCPEKASTVSRAALLCKSDLVSQMVGEFPELQGTMGGVYAACGGEDPEVAQAIREHYQPVSAEGEIPESLAGSILSLADKTDTVVGFFGIGATISGTSDPFGLRRRAIGILRILLERQLQVSLSRLLDQSLEILKDRISKDPRQVRQEVADFLRSRFQHLLLGRGLPHDTIEAVLQLGFDDVPDCFRRIEHLERMRSDPAFQQLILGCKRTVNILQQARKEYDYQGPVRAFTPNDYTKDAEVELLKAADRAASRVEGLMEKRDYGKVLEALVAIKTPIDRFFEDVMVLVDESDVRTARLSLLFKISKIFGSFADFSKIVL